MPKPLLDNTPNSAANTNTTNSATTQRRKAKRSTHDPASVLSPEMRDEIEAIVKAMVKKLAIDPHKDAFSVEEFCRRYGIGHQAAYDQLNGKHLVGHKPPGCDRTLIRHADAEHWIEQSPLYEKPPPKPKKPIESAPPCTPKIGEAA